MSFRVLSSNTFRVLQTLRGLKALRCDQSVARLMPLKTSIQMRANLTSRPVTGNGTPKRNTLFSWDIISGLIAFGVWLGIVEEQDHPLIKTIKSALHCMYKEEYEKADTILHSALQMAQDLDYEDAMTYIYDVMANNYFMKKDYKRAQQLFAVVFSQVLQKGMSPTDEAMIEISIKMSHIFSQFGDWDNCQTGFDFCLTEQNKRVKDFKDKSEELSEDETNSLALLGMCYDYYAKHLSSIGQFDKAIDNYKTALDLCIRVNGETHPQTLVLFNDMSATFVHKKDYEKALHYLKKAIDGAVRNEDKNLANYYYNIGSLYLIQLNKDLALKSCKRSLSLTLDLNDKSLERKARECIAQSN